MALVAAFSPPLVQASGIEAVVWLAQGATIRWWAVLWLRWLAPGLLALWACAYDADTSLGYASLLAMPLVVALPGSLGTVAAGHPFPPRRWRSVVAFWVWNRYPSRRLWRYRGSLEQCWCCGFRERAIREAPRARDSWERSS
jgi:hypothetical protein